MQTTAPTKEEVAEWQQVFKDYRPKLQVNVKSPQEVLAYLMERYPLEEQDDEQLKQLVTDNVMWNDVFSEKLPEACLPEPRVFIVERKEQGALLYESQSSVWQGEQILLGIDMVSGFYMVEGSEELWDEINAFKGLDAFDIENFFCVAEYVKNAKKFGYL